MLDFTKIKSLCHQADIVEAACQAARADAVDLGDEALAGAVKDTYGDDTAFSAAAEAAIGKMTSDVPVANGAQRYFREAFLAWFGAKATLDDIEKKGAFEEGERGKIEANLEAAAEYAKMAAKSVKAYAHIRGALGEEGPALDWLKSQGSIQAFYGKEAGFEGLCVTVTAQGAGFEAGDASSVVLYTTKPPLLVATGGNGLRSFGGTTIIPEAMAQAINGLVMGNIIKEGETIYRPVAAAA